MIYCDSVLSNFLLIDTNKKHIAKKQLAKTISICFDDYLVLFSEKRF